MTEMNTYSVICIFHGNVEQVEVPNGQIAALIANRWVAEFGLGFHPDTRGRDYVGDDGKRCLNDRQASQYDEDMDTLFALAIDPYQTGLDAMTEAGLIEGL